MTGLLLIATPPGFLRADDIDEVYALSRQVVELAGKGDYAQAVPIAVQALALAERNSGKDHPDTISCASNLASVYLALGRYGEAEPLFRRVLEMQTRTLGAELPETLTSQNNLAGLYRLLGRYDEAASLLQHTIETRERVLGREHPDTLASINNMALVHLAQGRYDEAGKLFRRVLEARERVLGSEHPDTLSSINNLAGYFSEHGSLDEAETLYRRAVETQERAFGKEHPATLTSIANLAGLYVHKGNYGEAQKLNERVLGVRERVLGMDHPDTLNSVSNLGFLYSAQGNYAKAEPLYLRSLTGKERVLGAEHPSTLTSINNMAGLYRDQGRYRDAEPLYERLLEARQRLSGNEHPETITCVNNLAVLYQLQGRYGEAERLFRRALDAAERVFGKEQSRALASLNNLAFIYNAQGRYGEAEPLYVRALETRERVFGKDHPETLVSINNLAGLYFVQGRYGEVEPLYLRALEAAERVFGKEHPYTLVSIDNLAGFYRTQSRIGEAEPLFRRVLEARERVLGKDHPDTLRSISNLASQYKDDGRHDEAEALYARVLGTQERSLGKDHPHSLESADSLAGLYETLGRHGASEQLYKRVLEVRERVLGNEHPETLATAVSLARLYRDQRRYGEAEQLLKRALEGRERQLGRDHPDTGVSLGSLAALYFLQDDWHRAVEFWRRGAAVIVQQDQRDAGQAGPSATSKKRNELTLGAQVLGLVKAASRHAPVGSASDAEMSREMFETAQRAFNSEAAQSLTQMAARGATADPGLATLTRERQDLVMEWRKRDEMRVAAIGATPDRRDARAEKANLDKLSAVDARIAEIDKELTAKFPNYAALVREVPLPVVEAQALLAADEALVMFLDTPGGGSTPEETFVWVVTKTNLRWVRSDLGTPALTREVQALRCGLDASAWAGSRCPELTGIVFDGSNLPFDQNRAHRLYMALFGQVEDLIKDKHLLLVPSGPLTQLPFQVLVTEPPAQNGDYKSVAWMVREHALTVLPAVSSLKALRRVAHQSVAVKPMIGFGNPLLDGQQNDPKFGRLDKKRAELAREKQSCYRTAPEQVATLLGLRGGVKLMVTRGGLAQVAAIREQSPLPETADELCAVARDLQADPSELRLGARATEREVKALSINGQLAQYRIVHFATHGALAGEVSGNNEPGLLLTPPETASAEDDGYLSVSEIATLKLNADWVILSACNTAAGNAEGAQALSGLTRAFIYAQARALLVSHWAVNSDATVKLITAAMREMANHTGVGRAEALRRSMIMLIDRSSAREAHPAYWAPFIVVGEGTR